MGNKKASIACISGESVCLKVTERGKDLERRLAKAMKEQSSAPPGIKVVSVDRDELQQLSEHMNSTPNYITTVNGKPTSLEVEQYALLSYSLIISKVVDKQIMMHGIKDGHEPRKKKNLFSISRGLDWKKIRDNDDRGCYSKWNLGLGTILEQSMSKEGSPSSSSQPKKADEGTSSSSQPKTVDKGTSSSSQPKTANEGTFSSSKPKRADKGPPETSKKSQ